MTSTAKPGSLKPMSESRVVLAIDPGTVNMGYSVLETRGVEIVHIDTGIWHAPKEWPFWKRMLEISRDAAAMVKTLRQRWGHASMAVVEVPFIRQGGSGAISLAASYGVALEWAARSVCASDDPAAVAMGQVLTLSNGEIKRSVALHGHAGKESVAECVMEILGLEGDPGKFDATDAAAGALVGAWRLSGGLSAGAGVGVGSGRRKR